MAQAFDANRLESKGEPVPVAEHLIAGPAFSVSGNGILVYQ